MMSRLTSIYDTSALLRIDDKLPTDRSLSGIVLLVVLARQLDTLVGCNFIAASRASINARVIWRLTRLPDFIKRITGRSFLQKIRVYIQGHDQTPEVAAEIQHNLYSMSRPPLLNYWRFP